MEKGHLKLMFMLSFCVASIVFTGSDAFAYEMGVGGKFEEFGKLIENDILKGGIGWGAGMLGGMFTGYLALTSKLLPAIGAFVGTAIIANAPTFIKGVGAVIF